MNDSIKYLNVVSLTGRLELLEGTWVRPSDLRVVILTTLLMF
jgi:hypothetical protein